MKEKQIFLYHRVMRRENFEKAAKDLFNLLQAAQKKNPNQSRVLYVDIDGHRNEKGGYDDDMLELQKEFGLGFLLPFFTEVHFPLISIDNPNEQCNDIPDKLEISNADNKRDSSLNALYIENYSNTEFISKKEVYEYLKKVSDFLKEYNDLDTYYALMNNDDYDPMGWMNMWRLHIKDLINELFNSFLYGNLITATAMTRSLIECYVYLSILKKEKSAQLLDEWYLCSIIKGTSKYAGESKSRIIEVIKQYCQNRNIDFNEKWNFYINKNENTNSWLKNIISKKRITFRSACIYLNKIEIYDDFQFTSSFVHGQDITTKLNPFLFYESIYSKFHIMISYIFESICLFTIEEDLIKKIQKLKIELIDLNKNIINEQLNISKIDCYK